MDTPSPVRKVALITGVTGQDGSYLTELLLAKGYVVHGLKRRSSSYNHPRLEHIMNKDYPSSERFHLHYADLLDFGSLCNVLRMTQPDEIYNLGAQSHVQVSFELPQYTAEVSGVAVMHMLEAIRSTGLEKTTRFYQASTSELYGKVHAVPQNEETPFHPRSPYGVAKLYGFWAVKNYREAYDMFCCNGILFNHESPRRGEIFVTRKITMAVANIKLGKQECLLLGNVDAKRDWGHARDYVYCMWLMLQQQEPDDFVIGTGETTTVRKFAELAFARAGIPIRWEGPPGVTETGVISEGERAGQVVVRISPKYFRPSEVDLLLGDPTKAKTKLGWNPKKTSLQQLVNEMVDADLDMAGNPTAYLKY
ncbi:g6729 [Coccomyxa viridis]|uniref:GDP-mannose 4,6-dehydratase n=1 Tax=Coccomyxa viridis TaxID=1274662 RepID=A0ABP1G024_9CHLO